MNVIQDMIFAVTDFFAKSYPTLQNSMMLLGIALAVLGAVLMSFGAHYQHRGVDKVERLSGENASKGLSLNHLRRLLTRPSWAVGTAFLGLAIVCQLAAMSMAPLIVVQPLGAIALVVTTLVTAKTTGVLPTKTSIIAIIACAGGIFVFVGIAAHFAIEHSVDARQTLTVLVLLAIVVVVLLASWIIMRQKNRRLPLFYIVAAGILYGFVATLAKVVIKSVQAQVFDFYLVLCVIGLITAAALGAYFVQTAYSSGPADLVIAGLTVVDPIVAVLIGLFVLGEGNQVPWWGIVIFALAGGVAAWGVFTLARHHPQMVEEPARR